jgi:dTDP-4-dehydrorhamnose reductase
MLAHGRFSAHTLAAKEAERERMADYVVFGAAGQLGTELVNHLEQRGAGVEGVDREQCDITSSKSVAAVLERARPSVVFNAAGFADVDQAESVRERVMKVNGVGAGIVAAHTRRVGARLLHFSSSYVFGDGHHEPIGEDSSTDPLQVYGASKLWGESLVQRNCPESWIVRSGALYSRFGKNIVRTLIEVALSDKERITMVQDEIVAPTPAFLVAQTAIDLTDQEVFGVFHASTRGACSWYAFVDALVDRLELDVEVKPITSERWGAPARRPRYSALDNVMLRALGLDSFPSWDLALDAFIERNGEQIIWEVS